LWNCDGLRELPEEKKSARENEGKRRGKLLVSRVLVKRGNEKTLLLG